jgi:hypothetical protein
MRHSGSPTALARLALRLAVPFGCRRQQLFAHLVSADDPIDGVLPAASGQSDAFARVECDQRFARGLQHRCREAVARRALGGLNGPLVDRTHHSV